MVASTSGLPERAFPWRFVVAAIVVTAIIAGLVGYLGSIGGLGGVIPGERSTGGTPGPPPPNGTACEGRGAMGHFHFVFVAGSGGAFNFNGTVPGPCVAVQQGSTVNVTLMVTADSSANHSWVLISSGAGPSALPAIPGAGFANGTRLIGIAPGTQANFSFVASPAGSYEYICEVPGHFDLGMHGNFSILVPPPALGARNGGTVPPDSAAAMAVAVRTESG